MSNGELKKVEDLCSQDFIDSAEGSADVRISHSTVTYIDPNLETGSGTISFAVGKHKIKVWKDNNVVLFSLHKVF